MEDNTETPTQLLERIARDVGTAADNLLESKVLQAAQSNKYRNPDTIYAIGDRVLLSTKNLHNDALLEAFSSTRRLQPTYIGPFTVIAVDSAHSTVTLDLPVATNKCRVFHISLIKPYLALADDAALSDNNLILPTADTPVSPPKKQTKTGPEHFIDTIVDHKKSGRGFRFLVKWKGFPDSHNEWMTFSALKHTAALDAYLKIHQSL